MLVVLPKRAKSAAFERGQDALGLLDVRSVDHAAVERHRALVAQAVVEGYDENKSASQPLWGYHFRVLTAQGAGAKGGARSYIVDGEMSGGFGLIAYPADYGRGGIMTFIVNQDGVVYEKDLGKDTEKIAAAMKKFDPDKTWKKVE